MPPHLPSGAVDEDESRAPCDDGSIVALGCGALRPEEPSVRSRMWKLDALDMIQHPKLHVEERKGRRNAPRMWSGLAVARANRALQMDYPHTRYQTAARLARKRHNRRRGLQCKVGSAAAAFEYWLTWDLWDTWGIWVFLYNRWT